MRQFLFILCFFPLLLSAESKVTYIYEKDMEGIISRTEWVVSEANNESIIEGKSTRGKASIITYPDGNTKSFNYESKEKQTSMERNGNVIFASREVNGEKEETVLKAGRSQWIQEFDFSLRSFVMSPDSSIKFYIVHPDKLSLHSMQVSKDGYEHIDINGQVRESLKAKVTLTGFKKMFWKGELWYDPANGDLLRYKANEGPNTPVSIITLISKVKGD